MGGRVVSVNVGVPIEKTWARSGRTGIDKRPVLDRRVRVSALGLEHDAILNTRHHGGPDQALYAYAREDAAWWADELDRELAPGNFGENLSTEGVDVSGARIGERWAIGPTVVVEVVKPRIPCPNFAGFWGVPDLVKRFARHGTPGAYLRVLAEGDLGAGDQVEIVLRPDHALTIADVFDGLMRKR